jgi:hypothetical protein
VQSKSVLVHTNEATAKATAHPRDFSSHIHRVAWAAGSVVLLGVLFDLGALVAQRSAVAEWEFIAVTRALEALPSLLIAIVLFYFALHFGRSSSLTAHRILAASLIVMGVVGGVLGFLVVTNYFGLARTVAPEAKIAFRATVAKAIGLAALDFLVLVPAGILGFRRPKS